MSSFRLRRIAPLLVCIAALSVFFAAPVHALADTLSWSRTYSGPDNLPGGDNDPIPVAGAFNAVSFADADLGWAVGVRADNVGSTLPSYAGLFAFTPDGGSTWTSETVPTTAELYGVVARSVSDVWAVGSSGTIAHWNGFSWATQTVTGWPSAKAFRAIAFSDASHGWAVGDGLGVVKTSNGGANWSIVTTPTTGATLRAISAVNTTSAVAVGDGGTMKTLAVSGPNTSRTISIANLYGVTFTDARHGWAVGDDATCMSTSNGGASWVAVQLPLPPSPPGTPPYAASDLDLRSVAFADADDGIAVGDYQMAWRTFDGGADWQVQPLVDAGTLGDLMLSGVAFPGGSAPAPVTVGRTASLFLSSSDDKARAYKGAWSDRVLPPPAAPTGVAASDGGTPGPRIRVGWTDASTNEDGFVVQRAQNSTANGAFSTVATLGAGVTAWIDTSDNGVDWGSTWYYRVKSYRGDASSAYATSGGFRVDTVPPISSSDAAGAYIGSAHINLSANDGDGSGVASTHYILDGGSEHGGISVDVSGYTSHTLEFWSVDLAGNAESPHKTAEFTIAAPGSGDSVPPTTTSDAAPLYAGPAHITLTSTDNEGGTGVAWTYHVLDGVEGHTAAAVDTVDATSTGAHTLIFWAVDAKGNTESSHTVSFIIDGVAPSTTSDAKTAYTGSATIKLKGTDNVGGSGIAHTYYRLDAAASVEATSVKVTAWGAHVLRFWSVDVARTVESSHTASFSVKGATTVSIHRSTTRTTHGHSVTLSGTLKYGKRGDHVRLYYRRSGHSWTWRTVTLTSTKWSSVYRFSNTKKAKGSYYFYVSFLGDATRLASRSPWVKVSVTR